MRETRTYGSVRGASSNGRPYRDPAAQFVFARRMVPLLTLRYINVIKRNLYKSFSNDCFQFPLEPDCHGSRTCRVRVMCSRL
jgi:hypothetical protein